MKDSGSGFWSWVAAVCMIVMVTSRVVSKFCPTPTAAPAFAQRQVKIIHGDWSAWHFVGTGDTTTKVEYRYSWANAGDIWVSGLEFRNATPYSTMKVIIYSKTSSTGETIKEKRTINFDEAGKGSCSAYSAEVICVAPD